MELNNALFFIIPFQRRIVTAFKKILANDYYCDCHNPSHCQHISISPSFVMGYVGIAVGMALGAGILGGLDDINKRDPLDGLPSDVMDIITPKCTICNEF